MMKYDNLTADDADLVQRLEQKVQAFIGPLQNKDGFNSDKFEDLLEILDECQTAWEIEPYIPMAATAAFIDLTIWPENMASWYEEGARQEIYDAAHVLHERINDIVNNSPPPHRS